MRSFESMQAAADHSLDPAAVCSWCGYTTGDNVAVPCELRAQMRPPVLIVSVICQDCAEAVQETIAICRGEQTEACGCCGTLNNHPGKCWQCGETL